MYRLVERQPAAVGRWVAGACLLAATGLALAQQAPASPAGAASAPSALSVVTGDADTLALTTATRNLRHRLSIVVDSPRKGIALRVRVVPLRGPDGAQAAIKLTVGDQTGADLRVPDAGVDGLPVDAELVADLPRAGEYSTHLVLLHGDAGPVVRTLKVTWTTPALSVAAFGTTRAATSWAAWRGADLDLSLQGPVDHSLQVMPALTDLAHEATGQQATQAQAKVALTVAGHAVTGPVELPAGTLVPIKISARDLPAPGLYKGQLQLTAPDRLPVAVAYVLQVRDPAWLAAVLIAGGAWVSLWLRRAGGDQRPRLLWRQQNAALREHVEIMLTEASQLASTESDVLRGFLRRLAAQDGMLRQSGSFSDTDAQSAGTLLEGLRAKVDLFGDWVAARRQMAALPKDAPAAGLAELQANLDTLGTALRSESALTSAQRDLLGGLPARVEQLQRDSLLGALASLRSQTEAQRTEDTEGVAGSAFETVLAALARAEQRARGGDLVTARTEVERARRAYAGGVIERLRARLREPAPPGVTDWVRVQAEVDRLLQPGLAASETDAETAMTAYSRALRVVLEATIVPLESQVARPEALEAALKNVDATHHETLKAEAARAAAALARARTACNQGEMPTAWQAYRDAFNGWQAALQATGAIAKAQRMGDAAGPGGDVPVAEPAPAAAGVVASDPALVRRSLPAPPSSDLLDAQRRRIERWLDWVAVLAAMALGLLFVWSQDADWGGPADWAMALLWGLGLHQVSGYTFEGAMGLRDKLVK